MRRIKSVVAVAAVMVASLAVSAAPAMADVSEFDQEAVSGDVDLSAEISLAGDNSNQAAPVLQFANAGNNQDALEVDQFDSEADDFEFEGGSISFEPEFEFDSDQTVRQTAATGWGW